MAQITQCPNCQKKVSLPDNFPPQAKVRCPFCTSIFRLSEAQEKPAPVAEPESAPEPAVDPTPSPVSESTILSAAESEFDASTTPAELEPASESIGIPASELAAEDTDQFSLDAFGAPPETTESQELDSPAAFAHESDPDARAADAFDFFEDAVEHRDAELGPSEVVDEPVMEHEGESLADEPAPVTMSDEMAPVRDEEGIDVESLSISAEPESSPALVEATGEWKAATETAVALVAAPSESCPAVPAQHVGWMLVGLLPGCDPQVRSALLSQMAVGLASGVAAVVALPVDGDADAASGEDIFHPVYRPGEVGAHVEDESESAVGLGALGEGEEPGVRPRPRRRRERNPIRDLLGAVIGGALGLAVTYLGLCYIGGPQFNMLELPLPGLAKPAEEKPKPKTVKKVTRPKNAKAEGSAFADLDQIRADKEAEDTKKAEKNAAK